MLWSRGGKSGFVAGTSFWDLKTVIGVLEGTEEDQSLRFG